MSHDQRPTFVPTIVADEIAQGHHGIHIRLGPAHPRLLQPRFDHDFVSCLPRPTPDGPMRRLEGRIVDVVAALGEVAQRVIEALGVEGVLRGQVRQGR